MGFKASEKVEPLEYDLTPWGPAGVVPEPSDKQVSNFQRALVNVVRDSGLDVAALANGQVDLAEIGLDKVLETSDAMLEAMTDAAAELTGLPHSVLRPLPYRVKTAFIGWLSGEFGNPQQLTPATSASPAGNPSV